MNLQFIVGAVTFVALWFLTVYLMWTPTMPTYPM